MSDEREKELEEVVRAYRRGIIELQNKNRELESQLSTIRRETFIEAMAIAQKYVQRTNSDIAYGIFNEIRELHVSTEKTDE